MGSIASLREICKKAATSIDGIIHDSYVPLSRDRGMWDGRIVGTEIYADGPLTTEYRLGIIFDIPSIVEEYYKTRTIPLRIVETDMKNAILAKNVTVLKVIVSIEMKRRWSMTPSIERLRDDVVNADSPEIYDYITTICSSLEWTPATIIRLAIGRLRPNLVNHLVGCVDAKMMVSTMPYNDIFSGVIKKYGSTEKIHYIIDNVMRMGNPSATALEFVVEMKGINWADAYIDGDEMHHHHHLIIDAIWKVYPALLIVSGRYICDHAKTQLTVSRPFADVSFVWV